MITLAEQNNPTATFEAMDCRNISQKSGMYDGIVCGFCIPYLSAEDCDKFVQDCYNLLHRDGILYFSFIE
jgi:2-polyprenyl-3-methyl-5-hydroxy-6-metoxy-1,4-benzoquinol methylase